MKNVSKLFGTPSTREGGIKQHRELVKKLRKNDVWSIPFMHRGYLVLKHEKAIGQRGKAHPVDIYPNYLQKSKPTGKYIMVSKV